MYYIHETTNIGYDTFEEAKKAAEANTTASTQFYIAKVVSKTNISVTTENIDHVERTSVERATAISIKEVEKPWYPDSSGDWVEHIAGNPPPLNDRNKHVFILTEGGRNAKCWHHHTSLPVKNWNWYKNSYPGAEIVAYKIAAD